MVSTLSKYNICKKKFRLRQYNIFWITVDSRKDFKIIDEALIHGVWKTSRLWKLKQLKVHSLGFFHNGQSSFNLTPDRPVKEISKCRGTDCYQGSTRESLVKGNMQWMVNWDHNSYNLAILDQKASPWVTLFPYKLYLFVATIRMKYMKNKTSKSFLL